LIVVGEGHPLHRQIAEAEDVQLGPCGHMTRISIYNLSTELSHPVCVRVRVRARARVVVPDLLDGLGQQHCARSLLGQRMPALAQGTAFVWAKPNRSAHRAV
jgi:hypothetical protein